MDRSLWKRHPRSNEPLKTHVDDGSGPFGAVGATVSDTVHNLLVSNKIIDAKKINVLPKKTVPKKEESVAKAEAAPVAAAAAVSEVPEVVAETPTQEDAPTEVVGEELEAVESGVAGEAATS